MKKLVTITTILLFVALKLSATSLTVDSLGQQSFAANDSLKGPMYAQIATEYLKYDTISSKKKKLIFQNAAIKYTLMAIHIYSKYDDTTGLRICYNNLAKVYHSQKKYTQAKWFILQSNALARAKHDVPNVITTLIELASIKNDIKDYKLAMSDLNEALTLSTKNHYAKSESAVQQGYVLLYNHMQNYVKADIALKRHDFIEDSISRGEEAKLVAKMVAANSTQHKKKIYTISSRKSSKTNSSKKTVSL